MSTPPDSAGIFGGTGTAGKAGTFASAGSAGGFGGSGTIGVGGTSGGTLDSPGPFGGPGALGSPGGFGGPGGFVSGSGPGSTALSMSWPAELAAFIGDVRRRRLWHDLAIAVIVGGLGATIVAVIALLLLVARVGWLNGARAIGLAILTSITAAAVTLVKRAPRWQDRALIDFVEGDRPACHNLLVTAYDLTREPVMAPVKPYIRARVFADAVRVAQTIDLDALLPWRRLANVTGLAALAVLVASVSLTFVTLRARAAAAAAANATAASAGDTAAGTAASDAAKRSTPKLPPTIRHVAIDVIPPAYVGLPATTLRDPERLDVLAGSRLRLHIDATADELTLALDGLPTRSTKADGDAVTQELMPVQSGVLAITARTPGVESANAADAHRLIAVTVTPDQPPVVAITVPGHDLAASDPQGRVRFIATASDDYGLRTLTLHYTKVSGSGERFEFKEAELPLTITRHTARSWEGSAERSLHDLNVDVGDTIVYYAAATDNRPGQERAVSDSYVIEISQTGAAIAGGFAVPKDEDVFAISLNALIQKTEKLHNKRATLPAPEFAQAAAGLAIEQRMVRSEFLFSMGTHGRVEDEEEEAENSNEIQEGRLQNKGQSELTQAVDLMTLAERDLTDANTGDALKAQRAALAAVQKAQSRQRYFLRTIPIASRIDQSRRLTGNLSDAASSQHPAASATPDTHIATLRGLLTDCARLTAMLVASPGTTSLPPTAGASATADRTGAPRPREAGRDSDATAADRVEAKQNAATPSGSADAASMTDLASSIGARMMALDPTSTSLHAAAASLLQVAPLAARGQVEQARTIVRQAAALVVPIAQRAGIASAAAAADGADTGDPALRGAVVDALRRGGPARAGGAR